MKSAIIRDGNRQRYAVGVCFANADGDEVIFFIDPLSAADLARDLAKQAGTEVTPPT